MKRRSTLFALSALIWCAACAQTEGARLLDAARASGTASAAPEAALALAALPDDCRQTERGGVRAGDRLDVAVLRLDAALRRQNTRATACAGWFDALRADLSGVIR